MQRSKSKWKLVSEYAVGTYACGLRAGDVVELRKPLVILDHAGAPTGEVHPAGERWTVLPGAADSPGVVWFREPDGSRHTWDDDPSEIQAWFRRLEVGTRSDSARRGGVR